MKDSIYLDYNSTTPLHPEAEAAMLPFGRNLFGNAAGIHSHSREAWKAVQRAREQVARLVDAAPEAVIFTSGATESNWLALLGKLHEWTRNGRNPNSIRAAFSAIEHPCIRECAHEFIRRGVQVSWIPVLREGIIDLGFFDDDADWDLVSVMAVNHETGAIQPLKEIARRLDGKCTFFHTDAAQWAGRVEGSMRAWGTTAISLSAHKLYGPKGIGALVLRPGTRIIPLFPGSQEGGIRGGTVNTAGAVGFGVAAEIMLSERNSENYRLNLLRENFWTLLEAAAYPLARTVSPEISLPNTLHVRFPKQKGERIVAALDRLGISCSAGPACASGAGAPSPVLLAMQYSEAEAWEGVRFSLGRDTTVEEIECAGKRITAWLARWVEHVA